MLARKRQKLTHQTGRAVRILVNLDQVVVVAVMFIVIAQQQFTMARNRSQQVVEIMRHTARELTNRLHLLALHKLRLKCFKLGHIVQDGNHMRIIRTACCVQRHLNKGVLFVTPSMQELRHMTGLAGHRLCQPIVDRPPRPVKHFCQMTAASRAKVQELARLAVRRQKNTIGRNFQKRHRQVFNRIPFRLKLRRAGGLGNTGQDINIARFIVAFGDGHHDFDPALQPPQAMHLPRPEREPIKDIFQCLQRRSDHVAEAVIHVDDPPERADSQHRKGCRLGARAPDPSGLAQIIEPPDLANVAHDQHPQPEMPAARDNIFGFGSCALRLGDNLCQDTGRICQHRAKHLGQSRADGFTKPALGTGIGIADLARAIGDKADAGIMGNDCICHGPQPPARPRIAFTRDTNKSAGDNQNPAANRESEIERRHRHHKCRGKTKQPGPEQMQHGRQACWQLWPLRFKRLIKRQQTYPTPR